MIARSDTERVGHFAEHNLGEQGTFVVGRIVQSIPYLHNYRVNIGMQGGNIICTDTGFNGFGVVGARRSGLYSVNTDVLIYRHPSEDDTGYIIAALPSPIVDGSVNLGDWVQQAGNTGLLWDEAHYRFLKQAKDGDLKDYSGRRAVDDIQGSWGYFSESGIGIHIDSFQAFLRVCETCGVFVNGYDNYMRLASHNHDFQTGADHRIIRDDEGENFVVSGGIVYPWESVGLYKPGQMFVKEFSDQDVFYSKDKVKAKIDLDDNDEDLAPFYRYTEHGGYVGQGHLRMVVAPEKNGTKRKFRDADSHYDYGLWQEIIGLDGSHTTRSAKSIYFGKRVLIPNPRRRRLHEDQKEGDDGRKGNYKFSGQFGEKADPHKIGDVKVNDTSGKKANHLLRVAGILDLLSHCYNWKSYHPFHYHKQDYRTPNESELQGQFNRAQDRLNFDELSRQGNMTYPTPKQITIDHRYGDVDYYQRESFWAMHEDGSVQIGDGYGATITLSGGHVTIDCPGDIRFLAGKNVVNMGYDVITRANNSVDISANKRDVRLKAQRNMQFLAGNSKERGGGGMLFETKSRGDQQDYQDKFGEAVKSSGIVFLAKDSEIGLLSKDILLRTGAGKGTAGGNITIDANKGNKDLVLFGRNANIYTSGAMTVWQQPKNEEGKATAVHRFSKDRSMISGNLVVEKGIAVANGSANIAGNVNCRAINASRNATIGGQLGVVKSIRAKGSLVAKSIANTGKSMFVGPNAPEPMVDTPEDPASKVRDAESQRTREVQRGERQFRQDLIDLWYADKKLGNDNTLEYVGFSYRDPTGKNDQYKTDDFSIVEPRWQQMVRFGMGSGGKSWTENAVTIQGRPTYPWPGTQGWKEGSSLLQILELKLFDTSAGRAKDRGSIYEEPELASFNPVKLDGNFKTII